MLHHWTYTGWRFGQKEQFLFILMFLVESSTLLNSGCLRLRPKILCLIIMGPILPNQLTCGTQVIYSSWANWVVTVAKKIPGFTPKSIQQLLLSQPLYRFVLKYFFTAHCFTPLIKAKRMIDVQPLTANLKVSICSLLCIKVIFFI